MKKLLGIAAIIWMGYQMYIAQTFVNAAEETNENQGVNINIKHSGRILER